MKPVCLFVFMMIICIESLDYDIGNTQICTQKPFSINFLHNCSRTRLTSDVQVANTNQIIFIYTFLLSSNPNISLSIINPIDYTQKIYFLFITDSERTIHFNNQSTSINLPTLSLSTCFYDSLSNYFTPKCSNTPITNVDSCEYLDRKYLPSENVSRLYYIYTSNSQLNFDFSISTNYISPFFNLQNCYGNVTKLTALAIFLIVFTSVLCVITMFFIFFCFRRQIGPLIGLIRNWCRKRTGQVPPQVTIG